MFHRILSLVLLFFSLLLALLPFLPASLAGWLIFLSLAAIPLFILNLIVFLLTFLFPCSRYRSRCISALSLLLLLPCMSNYLPIDFCVRSARRDAPHLESENANLKKTSDTTTLELVNVPVSFKDSSSSTDQVDVPVVVPVENNVLGEKQLSLTLISFNVDNFRLSSKILHAFADLAHDEDADIICLQERPHDNLLRWDSIKAAFPDYPYAICNSREDEVLNLAVISRYPLVGMTERYYPKSYNKQLFTDIILGPDTIRLFNVHLQTTGLADNRARPRHAIRQLFDQAVLRNQQADDLVSDVQHSPYPVIVAGDFNDTRAGYAYRRLRSYLRDANPYLLFTGSYQRFHSLYKIDHILCNSTLAPINYELIPNSWSDHKVQISRLSFKP